MKLKSRKGITLVEILIVVSISVLILLILLPIYGNLQMSSQLNEVSSLFIQTYRIAKNNSIARLNEFSHGVKMLSPKVYILYQGSSYSSRNIDYDRSINVGNGVNLSWNLTGGTDDINFSKGLGVPSVTGTVTITHEIKDSRVIDLNGYGKA